MSLDIRSKKIKLRALQKDEFEYRQKNNDNSTFRPIIKIDAFAKTKDIQSEDPSTDRKMSHNTLLEENKPIAIEKYDSENRGIP